MKSFGFLQDSGGKWLRQMVLRHPVLWFLCVFAGLPPAMVLAVLIPAGVILYPFAWAMGWMQI